MAALNLSAVAAPRSSGGRPPSLAGRTIIPASSRLVGTRSARAGRLADALAAARSFNTTYRPVHRERKQPKKGLWDQFMDAVTGLPGGIMNFAGKTVQTALAPSRAAFDLATGHLNPMEALAAATSPVWSPIQALTSNPWEEDKGWLADIGRTYAPVMSETATSIRRTGERLAATAAEPFGAEWGAESWPEAYRKGGIVGAVLEDLGNIALVAGGTGKLVGAPATAAAEGVKVGAEAAGSQLIEEAVKQGARGRGLIGLAERAEMPGVVQALEKVRKPLHVVARYGDPVEQAGRGVGKLYKLAAGETPMGTITRLAESGKAPRLLGRFTKDRRTLRDIEEQVNRETTAEVQPVAQIGVRAEKLSEPQRRFITGLANQELEPVRRVYEQMRDRGQLDQFRELVDNGMAGIPDDLRMTGDDALGILRQLDSPDSNVARIVRDLKEQAMRRTTQYSGMDALGNQVSAEGRGFREPGRVLDPEQVPGFLPESGQLTAAQDAMRGDIERRLDPLRREKERVAPRRIAAVRRSAAYDAALADIPPPPSVDEAFARGESMGKQEARYQQSVGRIKRMQGELADLVESHELAAGDRFADLTAMEARMDQLVDQIGRERAVWENLRARPSMARTLAGAGGVAEGPRAVPVRDELGQVVTDDAGRLQVTREVPAPGPEAVALSGQGRPRIGQVRKAVKAARETYRDSVMSRLDQLIGETRLYVPPSKAERARYGGIYDWLETVDPRTRRTFNREGWITTEPPSLTNLSPDQLAVALTERIGRPFTSDEAVDWYFREVGRLYDNAPVHELADEMLGLPGGTAERAMELGSDVLDNLETGLRQDVLDAREAFDGLDEAQRAEMRQVLELLDNEPNAGDLAYGDLLSEVAPDFMARGETGEILSNRGVSLREVAHAVFDEPEGPFFTTEARRLTPADQRAIGRMEEQARGQGTVVKRLEKEMRAAQRALAKVPETDGAAIMRERAKVTKLADRLERAKAEVERSAGDLAAERMALEPAKPMPVTVRDADGNVIARPFDEAVNAGRSATLEPRIGESIARRWHEAGSGGMSRAQRQAYRAGEVGAEAKRLTAHEARLDKRIAKHEAELAGLETELGRSVQDRLATDINQPFIESVGKLVEDAETGELRLVEGPMLRRVLRSMDDTSAMQLVERLTEEMDQSLGGPGELNLPSRLIDIMDDFREAMDAETRNQLYGVEAPTSPIHPEGEVRSNVTGRVADQPRRKIGVFERYDRKRRALLEAGVKRDLDRQLAAAPARFRPALQTARRMLNAMLDQAREYERAGMREAADDLLSMADDVLTNMEALTKAGIDPVHLIGGDLPESVVTGQARTGGGTLRGRRSSVEFAKKSGLTARNLTDYLQVEAKDARTRVLNEASKELREAMGKPAREVVPNIEMSGDPGQAARDAGWLPLTGDTVTPTTVMVPTAIRTAMDAYTSPGKRGAGWEALSWANRKWKGSVLPLSPRWHIGNVVGNAMMATVYAGMNPGSLVTEMYRIVNAARKHPDGLKGLWESGGIIEGVPTALSTSGLTVNERQALGQADIKAPKTKFGKFMRGSYQLNEFVDGMTRSSVYLSKLRKGAPSDAAVTTALRSLGNYNKMSQVERRYVREVIPFYAWLRHQTQAMMRLPMESPGRAMWMLHLGDLFSKDEDAMEMFKLIGANLPLPGGQTLGLSSVNPFPGVADLPLANPLALAQGLSPMLKLPIGALTGLNVDTMQQYRRPPSSKSLTNWGAEAATPLWRNPGELAYLTAGISPQLRMLRDVALDPDVARYQTGDVYKRKGRPVMKGGPAPAGGRKLATIMQGLGVPWVRSIAELEEVTRQRKEKEARR